MPIILEAQTRGIARQLTLEMRTIGEYLARDSARKKILETRDNNILKRSAVFFFAHAVERLKTVPVSEGEEVGIQIVINNHREIIYPVREASNNGVKPVYIAGPNEELDDSTTQTNFYTKPDIGNILPGRDQDPILFIVNQVLLHIDQLNTIQVVKMTK
jgi:hypothetical protein